MKKHWWNYANHSKKEWKKLRIIILNIVKGHVHANPAIQIRGKLAPFENSCASFSTITNVALKNNVFRSFEKFSWSRISEATIRRELLFIGFLSFKNTLQLDIEVFFWLFWKCVCLSVSVSLRCLFSNFTFSMNPVKSEWYVTFLKCELNKQRK